jgi:hypothetical protein
VRGRCGGYGVHRSREREAATVEFALDDAGDEVAGDDKEDVDTDEATGEAADVRVIEDDREYRDCTQAVDVRTIAERFRCFRMEDQRHAFSRRAGRIPTLG